MPVRFEIEVELKGGVYEYVIAVDFPEAFKELRVLEEKLVGQPIYTRKEAQVNLAKSGRQQEKEAKFRIDWHLVALPIVQEQSQNDPLFIFKQWLARMVMLRPNPSLITGDSAQEALEPNSPVTDFGAWFSGLLAFSPAAYTKIDEYLKQVMPDLKDIKNLVIGKDSRSLVVQFSNKQGNLSVPFGDLADGEKCFMICALVLGAIDAYGQVLCFWDEPEGYLAMSEVGHLVLALRRAFQSEALTIPRPFEAFPGFLLALGQSSRRIKLILSRCISKAHDLFLKVQTKMRAPRIFFRIMLRSLRGRSQKVSGSGPPSTRLSSKLERTPSLESCVVHESALRAN